MKKVNFVLSRGLVFWQADISKDREILDFVRGLAAILVYLSHADHNRIVSNNLLVSIKGILGEFGVSLFFIMSGYLIWCSAAKNLGNHYKNNKGIWKYATNRATRILPLYLVNILFCVTLLPLIKSDFAPTAGIIEIVRHLTFTQTFDPNVSRTINPVLWSLGYEGIFYMIVPVLLIITRKYTSILLVASWILSIYASNHTIPVVQHFLMMFCLFASGIFGSSGFMGISTANSNQNPLGATVTALPCRQ